MTSHERVKHIRPCEQISSFNSDTCTLTLLKKNNNHSVNFWEIQSNHDDNICLNVVQAKTQSGEWLLKQTGYIVWSPLRSWRSLDIWSWLEDKFPCLLRGQKKNVTSVMKVGFSLEHWRIWTLTSSQDMLYSAKTVRQRAAILRE